MEAGAAGPEMVEMQEAVTSLFNTAVAEEEEKEEEEKVIAVTITADRAHPPLRSRALLARPRLPHPQHLQAVFWHPLVALELHRMPFRSRFIGSLRDRSATMEQGFHEDHSCR